MRRCGEDTNVGIGLLRRDHWCMQQRCRHPPPQRKDLSLAVTAIVVLVASAGGFLDLD